MLILTQVRERLRNAGRNDLLGSIASDFLGMFERKGVTGLRPAVITLLLGIRHRVREEKDYDFADFIRKRLLENNIIVDDQGFGESTFRMEDR
jgi:cysteinyl-tRNA synthetase